jgi:hypothetical protein
MVFIHYRNEEIGLGTRGCFSKDHAPEMADTILAQLGCGNEVIAMPGRGKN